MRRYRRTAVIAILAGEVKAAIGIITTDAGGVFWWSNIGWAAVLLAGGGYLAAPHVRRLVELSDPIRSGC